MYNRSMQTYKGKCHCGAVQFEVDLDFEKVLKCNCSHCEVKGLLLRFVPSANFTLTKGESELTEYLFNKKFIHHLFCKHCGVEAFARGKGADGKETIAINVRALEGVDIDSLTLTPFDGKSW